MNILAITGTNTGVGKTIATAALAVEYRHAGYDVRVVKPVQTGEPEGSGDIFTIAQLSGVNAVECIRYPEPLSPHLAARRAGQPALSVAEMAHHISTIELGHPGVILVEGAGGLLVRYNDTESFADLIAALNAKVVVVTSLGLGSLNLAELTVEVARLRGLDVCGLIGGELAPHPDLATRLNLEELPIQCGVPLLGVLPSAMGQIDGTIPPGLIRLPDSWDTDL
ncbi:dethiobiotin synthase [Corynebacterium sp. ES2794-CONJ1]|uniref:dethiobiotin synthase n=1 Tax=Corynebacterium sp. ES2794-CONJ1 TaxID=2980553 RepID=UPI0021D9061C|nr:dethiobiotin synthase [Corynebacterium sp. ES2794-CONJ1]MCU9518271.1 dethiobiotin synthase [Corynebacterium sp. ES2794-CONJ1]